MTHFKISAENLGPLDRRRRAHTAAPTSAKGHRHIARISVKFATALEPGQNGSIRLAPLTPQRWRHLTPGDLITMHEVAAPIGVAEIVSVLPPVLG